MYECRFPLVGYCFSRCNCIDTIVFSSVLVVYELMYKVDVYSIYMWVKLRLGISWGHDVCMYACMRSDP